MLETVLANWWGILVVVALILLFFALDRKIARELAWNFVMEVEKNARRYGLAMIQDKKAWVYSWHPYLPPTVKLFVSAKLWAKIVDGVYAKLPDGGG